MKKIFVAFYFIVSFGSAHADSLLVNACKQAFVEWSMSKTITATTVQDFSNLNPPRVRMKMSDLLSTTISCEFSSKEKPIGLRKFCVDSSCYKPGEQRFDEVNEMLRRNGF